MENPANISLEPLLNLRRLLHQTPDLSGQEKATAQRIKDFLKAYSPNQLIEGLGGHGIAAIYQGKIPGPTVMIRCELDALPILEINKFKHRSLYDGLSHKCGHDGHMAIVAGLATLLQQQTPKAGKVILLFQPAEENGEGARAVLADKKFVELAPDFVFALHNLPGFPENEIVCKAGTFTAAVHSLIIRLKGKTSHAAEPEKGINPAMAIAAIIEETRNLEKPDASHADFSLITPIQINMGEEAYGISAGEGLLSFTLRTWTNKNMETLSQKVEKCIEQIASRQKLQLEIEWTQPFSATENDGEMNEIIKQAAQKNKYQVTEKQEPFKWGEDFGLFTEKYRGAMFGLGAGVNVPALHNPDYDFPDTLIPTGVKVFYAIINQLTDV